MHRRTLLLPLIATILLSALASPTLAQRIWEKTSFPAQSLQSAIGAIVAHPTDPDTIFVATSNQPALTGSTVGPGDGLFVTTDQGDTWGTLNDGVFLTQYNILSLAICAADPDVLYAGTIEAGIFKTVNGGQTWSNVSGGFQYGGGGFPNPNWGVTAIAVDPTNPDKVYVSVAQVAGLDITNFEPDHPGFFYSHDGGSTWTENNSGLPPRSDSASDGQSRTAVAGSIVIPPQRPTAILLGMLDVHVNTELFLNRNASTDGKIFANLQSGTGVFTAVNTGLPTGITQGPEVGFSLGRVSTSTMLLSVSTGPELNLWASHVGFTLDAGLSDTLSVVRNRGLFFTRNGNWQERNSGLPFIPSWTDPASAPGNTVRYENTYNMGTVAIAPGSFNEGCLVGALRSDMGNAASNDTKIYATKQSGLPNWLKNWDQGLDTSPTLGYTEANAGTLVINANTRMAFAQVRWSDGVDATPSDDDDGIYRVTLR